MDAGQDGTARAAGRVQLLGWKRDEHGKQQKADSLGGPTLEEPAGRCAGASDDG